jgi:peptidoglycan hydrolase-like protein with peptidoglycan-binding domain
VPNIRSFNSIDSVFGPQIEAVKLFQEDQLTVGGIVGPETWAGGRSADADASERSCGNA